MQHEHIIEETDGQVAQITLNRPDKLNCLAERTWDELDDALETADENPDVRAIVLSGKVRPSVRATTSAIWSSRTRGTRGSTPASS